MEEVLVSVKCPAISETYDVYIPQSLTVGETAKLLGRGMEELSERRYVSSGRELLCLVGDDILMKQDFCIRDYKIQNGDKLLLF